MHCAARYDNCSPYIDDSNDSDVETIDLYSRSPTGRPPLMSPNYNSNYNEDRVVTRAAMELLTNTREETPDETSLLQRTTSFVNSVVDTDRLIRKGSASLLNFLSGSQRMFWFFVVLFLFFVFYPLLCLVIVGLLMLLLVGGQSDNDTALSNKSVRWTVTAFSFQMKNGFLTSPPFADKSGQWRVVIKQKKNLEGLQTSLGLLCTDMSPATEAVSTNATFYCTTSSGQEISLGGSKHLTAQANFYRPGDSGFTRNFRLLRSSQDRSETVSIHCHVEFHRSSVTLLKRIAKNVLPTDDAPDDRDIKRGRNTVTEHGRIEPLTMEFPDVQYMPPELRTAMRFVQNPDTRTFTWEIPGFYNLIENADLWGIYSPQFFVQFQNNFSIWRLKLVEVQGVFRLHVQLRGLPTGLKQIKLWYLLQLVDPNGDSIIPEYASARLKYPDYINLWETTRHILYRREFILDRFVGGADGSFSVRISVQIQENENTLMAADSDEWIQRPTYQPVEPSSPLLGLPTITGMEQALPSTIRKNAYSN